ncbi:MAG: DUF1501 domain-containing protein [Planctomycetaceae bacterium]|nr:DUF1501 domain-containing protein [Planctomycetaceae bacterium]
MSRVFSRLQRRSFIGLGLAASLTHPLRSLPAATSQRRPTGRAKNVIVILEQGGLSHLDTWDPKPDAVAEHRSPYKPIATRVPGIQFTELCAKSAAIADKLAVVRSFHHTTNVANGHPLGTQYVLSGSVPGGPIEMPDIGSVVAHRLGSDCEWLPPYIMVPGNHEQAAMTRHGFLSASTKVFKTGGRDLSDPAWKVNDLGLLTGIDEGRFHDRLDLLSNLNVGVRPEPGDSVGTMSAMFAQASDMLSNPRTQRAFRLSEETDAVREAYGRGHRGQCYLLGRRLIESGVRFVTVDVREPMSAKTPGGFNMNWDHHDYIYTNGSCGTQRIAAGGEGRYGIGTWWMMGSTDQAFAALVRDLDDRGLLDETLVCFVTEFGRTPRLNKFQGRDHWTNAYSMVFAGAGVRGGQVIGKTDRDGGFVLERPLRPEDYASTVYEKLGLDHDRPLYTRENRPVFISHGGKVIAELM